MTSVRILISGTVILIILVIVVLQVAKSLKQKRMIKTYMKGPSSNSIIDFADIYFERKNLKSKKASTVIRQESVKQKDTSKCSYCKKKVKRLSFYASRNGQVIGLCDMCKVQAERQALLRI